MEKTAVISIRQYAVGRSVTDRPHFGYLEGFVKQKTDTPDPDPPQNTPVTLYVSYSNANKSEINQLIIHGLQNDWELTCNWTTEGEPTEGEINWVMFDRKQQSF